MAGQGYGRRHLQETASAKLEDALLLASHGRWSNAYYLAGYSVELGLKACIARRFREDTLPDPALVRNVYVHDLERLVGVAEMDVPLRRAQEGDRKFASHWSIAVEWRESIRYESVDRSACLAMLDAIGDEQSGILQWLKKHW